jgi:NADH dehydrogenase
MTFVVIGGGPTGVEMAGQIAELSRHTLKNNFRRIDPARDARILLLDGGPMILASFGRRLSDKARKELNRLGVEVHNDALVTGVDERGLDVNSDDPSLRRIEAVTKVWAAGVSASPLGELIAERSGVQPVKGGHVPVEPDCTLPGHPEVFVVGDLMHLDGLPGVAEVAMQSGMHAAIQIGRRLEGDTTPRRFRYRNLGELASISRYYAIAKLGPVGVGGVVGWLLWLVVHLTFLTGFKNRFTALLQWIISFFGRSRSQRTITMQQVMGRQALQDAARRDSAP